MNHLHGEACGEQHHAVGTLLSFFIWDLNTAENVHGWSYSHCITDEVM